jgi:hypothetical protein
VRVGAPVEDDESGVDPVLGPAELHVVGVHVAAHVAAGLEEGDLVLLVQVVRRGEARDAAADDGDPHGAASRLSLAAARRGGQGKKGLVRSA